MFEAGRIERGLRWMGDAPNVRAIVARLRRRGIRGIRRSTVYCPLTLYLARRAGVKDDLRVLSDVVRWRNHEWPLPPRVRIFVRRFDGGRYPSLEVV